MRDRCAVSRRRPRMASGPPSWAQPGNVLTGMLLPVGYG